MNNILKLTLSAIAFCLLLQNSAHPEGGDNRKTNPDGSIAGQWGINRRVATNGGYSQVQGAATVDFGPDASLGQKNWLTNADSPTFYLGATGGTEVDAGFQYDLQSPPNYPNYPNYVVNTAEDTWWLFIRRGLMRPVAFWDDTNKRGVMWQGGKGVTSLSTGNLTFRVLEKSETSAQGLVQRAGCMGLNSDKGTAEAFYFDQGYAKFNSKLSAIAVKQQNSVKFYSVEGMNIGDDITIGSDGGRIVDIHPATNTVDINVNLVNTHPQNTLAEITYRSKTTLKTGIAAGATQITVQPNSGLEKDDVIRIDAEKAKIVSAVTGSPDTFNISSVTALSAHGPGTLVTWLQFPNKAYANHPVAPWYGDPVFDTKDSGKWKMKRVIGMTRATGTTEELDGSWLTSTFTGGMVKKSGDHELDNWEADDVDQSLTGYDAKGGAKNEAYDQRKSTKKNPLDAKQLKGGVKTTLSKTIVEFPNLKVTVTSATTLPPHKVGDKLTGEEANLVGRQDNHDSRVATETDANLSRYNHESVNINLRKYVAPKASPVSPTKASG